MTPDPIEQAISQAGAALTSITSRAHQVRNNAAAMLASSQVLLEAFSGSAGVLAKIYSMAGAAVEISAPRAFDIQISLAARTLDLLLASQEVQNFEWKDGEFSVKGEPVGSPHIMLARAEARPSTLLIIQRWQVALNGGQSESFETRQEIAFDLRAGWPKAQAFTTRRVLITDLNGADINPFQRLPVAGGVRARAWSEISSATKSSLGSVAFEIPSPSELALGTSSLPLSILVKHNLTALLKVRSIPQRRAAYLVSLTIPYGFYDVGFRIKSEFLATRIRHIVEGIQGASLQNVRHYRHALLFDVHIFRREKECIAEARVWVDASFAGEVISKGPTRLAFLVYWRRWEAHWEVDWCFHKCDEASDEIRRTIEDQLNQYSRRETSLLDLSGQARSSTGWIDDFGLLLMWESK